MHEPVPHRPHQMPRNFGMSFLHIIGNVARRLADDNEIEQVHRRNPLSSDMGSSRCASIKDVE
jgi:hypothetical protein